MKPKVEPNRRRSKEHLIKKIKLIRKLRKFGIAASILLNVILLTKFTNTEIIIEREYYLNTALIDKAYSLHNYPSMTDSSSDVQERFDKLTKQYEKDKTLSKTSYYKKNGDIDEDWERYCIKSVRRILSIKSRIETISTTLDLMLQEKQDYYKYYELLVYQKAYDEKLSEMSNFYAKFIANYTYDNIIKTID
jgi:hypothetical protein